MTVFILVWTIPLNITFACGMIKIPLERCIKSSHHTDLSLYSYHWRNTFAVRCHASYFQSGYDQVFSSIFYSNICSRAPRLDLPLGCPGLFAAYVVYEQLQNQLPFPWNKAVKCTDLVLIRDTEMSESTVHNCIATESLGFYLRLVPFRQGFQRIPLVFLYKIRLVHNGHIVNGFLFAFKAISRQNDGLCWSLSYCQITVNTEGHKGCVSNILYANLTFFLSQG